MNQQVEKVGNNVIDKIMRLYKLEHAIKKMAIKIAENYPNVEHVGTFEQLFAIESTYEGVDMANEHYVDFMRYVLDRLKVDREQQLDMMDDFYYGELVKKVTQVENNKDEGG